MPGSVACWERLYWNRPQLHGLQPCAWPARPNPAVKLVQRGECAMPDKIDTIPEHTRWELATKGLTGAYIAISNTLKQAVGQKKFEEFNGALWHEAGKGAKEFADRFGLATENAGDVEAVMHLLAKASMG